jgi:5-(carboxyamino)imidazole ribonucleotide synthase
MSEMMSDYQTAFTPPASVYLPGSTIGMLGGGQLGRMTALAAKPLGYNVVVLTPEGDRAPACQVADNAIIAPYDDPAALKAFASQVDVVTLEFENIPLAALDHLHALGKPVHPGRHVLAICQHRLQEKLALQQAGLPVVPFYPIADHQALDAIPAACLPGVLKTAGFGYDGKGQIRVNNRFEVIAAFQKLGEQPCVLEAWMDLATEVSVIGARNHTGFAHFGVMENTHRHHILDTTLVPAQISPSLAALAPALTEQLMNVWSVVGLLCVEFFITRDGQLWINETAPRPHNSGHVTQNAFATSQFEQHVRAVCGLPLGPTSMTSPAAGMLNLLGDRWLSDEGTSTQPELAPQPDWGGLFADHPNAHLHLYGKQAARAGRKMGHINLTGKNPVMVNAELATISKRCVANPSTS